MLVETPPRLNTDGESSSLGTVAGVRESSSGWLAAAWSDGRLIRITIGHASAGAATKALRSSVDEVLAEARGNGLNVEQEELLDRLCACADGCADDFADVELDLDHLGPFARKVVRRCRRIPAGETMTYAELAAACGSPRAARAVGNVMASNRFPLVVPCHRVVGSGGGLGGFSAPQGVKLKKALLRREGAPV